MKSTFLRVLLAVAATYTFSALAQTSSAATPSSSSASPATSAPTATGGTKIGTISIQDAIFGSNEGQRDMQTLQKKLEPKSAELKGQNDELENLKKQLSTQGDKLNEDAASNLKKQIDSKQKAFERAYQDFQEDVQNQQQDIASRILQKMAPMIVAYAKDNGFAMIVDTSKTWPQSPVLWWDADKVDVTKPVVDAYNVQSGVAAPPAAPTGAKPAAPKPSSGAGAATTPKPAPPKPSEPPKQ